MTDAVRRIPTWLAAVGAAVIALGVGLPLGLLTGAESGGPAPPPTNAPSDARPSAAAAPATAALPSATGPPAGLTSGQTALWTSLQMRGVDKQSCRSYPAGEQLAGVIASITCTVQDGSVSELYFHQFRDATARTAYMDMRAAAIVARRRGQCSAGGESDGRWESGGPTLGRLVCVDNTKDSTTYFKMIWSSDASNVVAIIQDESRAATWAWWYAYGGSQFGRS